MENKNIRCIVTKEIEIREDGKKFVDFILVKNNNLDDLQTYRRNLRGENLDIVIVDGVKYKAEFNTSIARVSRVRILNKKNK